MAWKTAGFLGRWSRCLCRMKKNETVCGSTLSICVQAALHQSPVEVDFSHRQNWLQKNWNMGEKSDNHWLSQRLRSPSAAWTSISLLKGFLFSRRELWQPKCKCVHILRENYVWHLAFHENLQPSQTNPIVLPHLTVNKVQFFDASSGFVNLVKSASLS